MAPPPAASAAQPKPSPDLLGEAQQLMQPNAALAMPRRSRQVAAARASSSPEVPGEMVETLPDDWALKCGCLISSPSPLDWAATALPSLRSGALEPSKTHAAAASGVVITSALALALEHSLLQWRHPAQRLPPAILKHLSAPSMAAAEKDYVEGLNDAWGRWHTPFLATLFLATLFPPSQSNPWRAI